MLIQFPLPLCEGCVFSANVVQTVLSLHWLCAAIIRSTGLRWPGTRSLINRRYCVRAAGSEKKAACFLRTGVEKQSIQPMATAKKKKDREREFLFCSGGVRAFLDPTLGGEPFPLHSFCVLMNYTIAMFCCFLYFQLPHSNRHSLDPPFLPPAPRDARPARAKRRRPHTRSLHLSAPPNNRMDSVVLCVARAAARQWRTQGLSA